MRTRRVPIIVFLQVTMTILFVLGGCGSGEPGRYYGKDFSIRFPDDWEKKPSAAGVVITYGNPESTEVIGVQRQKVGSQQTLDSCMQFMQSHMQDMGGTIVDTGEDVISDTDACWMLYDTPKETLLAYYIKKGDYIYSLLTSAQIADFNEDDMIDIVKTFQFE